jgi:subtilisin family serine protease
MRITHYLVAAAVLVVAGCAEPLGGPQGEQRVEAPVFSAGGNAIDGSYIVVLEDGANPRAVAAVAGVTPAHVYEHALTGFAAQLNAGQVTAIRQLAGVRYVEEDQEFTADATQTMSAGGGLWGLDRIDQRSLPFSGSYTYNTTASTIYAYVIDTGIYTSHTQFGGRAANVYDAFGGNGQDCNGHGTHVAGTIGGATYGVAKSARLRGLRVLNCSGSGSTSGIIAAVDWLRNNRINPAVANMSLGGGYSSALNTAVNNLANSGVFMAVAAGNSSANACNASPASAAQAFTTAASTKTDARASYSNYGSCVDAYAPGSSVLSSWIGGSTATRTISGTSMASPHVAGVAALYKARNGNVSSATIDSWLKNNATTNRISGNPSGTPNRLLYKSTL